MNKKSLSKLGDKNPNWKGDKPINMSSLHEWVKRRLPKPKKCNDCDSPPRDLANKGLYDRNLENWEWLCRRCHMIKDGRMDKLIERGRSSWKPDSRRSRQAFARFVAATKG